MQKCMLDKAAVAAVVLAVVTSVHSLSIQPLDKNHPGARATLGTPGNDNPNQTPIEAISSALIHKAIPNANSETAPTPEDQKIMDQFGITKELSKRLPPLDIPRSLEGKTDEEIMDYAKQLMKRRHELQRKMTKNIANNSFLLMLCYFFSSNALLSKRAGNLLWLNRNFRQNINADWKAHQDQLANFLLEYARVKQVHLDILKTNRIAGAPIMKVPYAKNKYVKFPLWKTQKNQPLPPDTDVRNALHLLRNWWV